MSTTLSYQLCKSYRIDGRTRHHLITGLGKLEEKLHTVEQIKRLGKRIEEKLKGQNILLPDSVDDKIELLSHYYYGEIKKKRSYDTGKGEKDWQTVDLSTMKNKDAREVGSEWLCKQTFDLVGF